jgi:hypothetical protein
MRKAERDTQRRKLAEAGRATGWTRVARTPIAGIGAKFERNAYEPENESIVVIAAVVKALV